MKQLVASFSFIASALALAGCASDEFVGQNTDRDIITFNVNADNQTRAASSYCAVNMPPHFNVWADYTDKDNAKKLYIDGDKVNRKDGDNYQSEELRYWPMNIPTMSFYAYVDANYVSGTGESATETNSFRYVKDGTPVFENYKVNDDVAKQKDLMYAVAKDVPTKSNVSLNFRHALSQVCFKASNENPNIKITIHSVSINGLANTGTFSFPAASTSVNYLNHTDNPKQEDTGFYRGSWNLGESPEYTSNYTVPLDIALTTPAKTDPEITIDNLTCAEGTEEVPHSDFSKTLILLPQERNKASVAEGADAPANDGVYFILNLSIDNVATDANSQTVETNVASKKNYYIPVAIDWSPGNRYIYTFRFSPTWDPKSSSIISYDVTADDYNPNPETPDKDETPTPPEGASNIQITDNDNKPTGKYFADKNLGAATPYDSGLYFCWGDNIGHVRGDNESNNDRFTAANYSYSFIYENLTKDEDKDVEDSNLYYGEYLIKYIGYYSKGGDINESKSGNKLKLATDPKVDPAVNAPNHDNIEIQKLGKGWRMPTMEELYWLLKNCSWKRKTDKNGTYYEVSSGSNVMIIPQAGGFSNDNGDFNEKKTCLWTASCNSNPTKSAKAYLMSYDNSNTKTDENGNLIFDATTLFDSQPSFWGLPIRPIYDPELAKQQEEAEKNN